MKKLLLSIVLLIGASSLTRAQLLVEDFDYTAGSLLTSNGWTAHSGGGTNPIAVSASSLTFPSYSTPGVGGSAVSSNTGEDVNSTFSEVTSGSVYASFLLKVDTATSNSYFFHFMDAAGTTAYRGRVFFQEDATSADSINFGLTNGSSTGIFDLTPFAKSDTLLVVLKYTIIAGSNNDEVSLYVFDQSGSIATEPATALLGPLTSASISDINPARVALRQFSSTTDYTVDAIMVDTVWNLVPVTPPPAPSAPTYSISTVNTEDVDGIADSLGVYCFTQGVVMGVDLDGNGGYSFTIWDNGGINVFSPVDVDGYVVAEGDSILVRGTIGQFNGLTQIEVDSIVLVNSGNAIPAATVVTTLDETTESELIRIENFWVDAVSAPNYTLSDGTNTVVMRIDSDTDIPGNVDFNLGDTICYVIGIGGQFDNSSPYTDGYQFFPQRAADVDNSCGSIPPAPVPFYPIPVINNDDANGEPDSIGVYCWTKGVVLGVDLDGNSGLSFTLWDGEGINIFNFVDVSNYTVTEGDSLMARGSIDFYNGLTEFFVDSITLVNSGNPVPAPMIVSAPSQMTESEPIKINSVQVIDANEWPNGGSSNVRLLTCAGDTIIMRIDSDTDVDDNWATAPSGLFNVTGIGGQFDGAAPYLDNYQIFPMYFTDIDTTSMPAPSLLINELMAENATAYQDENGDFDDWIELYNNGTTDISLAGLMLTNDMNDIAKFQIDVNSGEMISAGGYAIVWADNETAQGDLHANFELDAAGGYIGLAYMNGCTPEIVDEIDYTALSADESFGRETDGNEPWVVFSISTPNAMNQYLSVEEVGNTSIKAWPNPNNGEVLYFNQKVSFSLFGLTGQMIMSETNVSSTDLSGLDQGFYLIETTSGEAFRVVVK